MVKIRLRRVGAKKQPSFRVVVADQRAARDGPFIEKIGVYNPRTEPETLRIDEARALYWLSVGAQPTESAARLLRTTGTMARFKRLKAGESLEDLVAEAEAEAEAAEEGEEEPVAEAEAAPPEAEAEAGEEEAPEEAEEEPAEEPVEAEEEGETASEEPEEAAEESAEEESEETPVEDTEEEDEEED